MVSSYLALDALTSVSASAVAKRNQTKIRRKEQKGRGCGGGRTLLALLKGVALGVVVETAALELLLLVRDLLDLLVLERRERVEVALAHLGLHVEGQIAGLLQGLTGLDEGGACNRVCGRVTGGVNGCGERKEK